MFVLVAMTSLVFFAIIAGFFYMMTNNVFVVEFGSGIWYFAVVLYILLLIVSLTYMFHNRFASHPRWQKLATGAIVVVLSGVSIGLGIAYRPFLNVKVNEKLGGFIDDLLLGTVPNFPPARAEAMIEMPPALDQSRASTCWAYAAALVLSTIKNKKVDPGGSRVGCVEKTDISKWSVSPQALIDLFDSSNKNNGAPVSEGLRIASAFALPSLKCVGGYTSQYNGSTSSCACGAPKTDWCLLGSSGRHEHSVCSDGSPVEKSDFFRNKAVTRLKDAETMQRAISSGVPVIVWLSFKKNGYPLWTGVENDGVRLKFRSPNFVCRPQDEKGYAVDTSVGGHAVSVIGYGTRADGVKYWEIQNSWGANWGNGGRAKIERGVDAWGIERYMFLINV